MENELLKIMSADWGEVCVIRIRDGAESYFTIDEAKELIQKLPDGIQNTKTAARAQAEDKVAKCEQRLEEARKYLDELK